MYKGGKNRGRGEETVIKVFWKRKREKLVLREEGLILRGIVEKDSISGIGKGVCGERRNLK